MKLTVFGKAYEVEQGSSAGELLKNVYPDEFKSYFAVKATDGALSDLFAPITTDTELTPVTFADEDGKKVYRHTCSHLMSMAVQQLYPGAKLAIGPAIENGFYYDFDVETPFKPDDLPEIEKAMEKLARLSIRPRRFTLPRAEAIALMEEKNEPYKVELIRDLPEDATISFYQMGDFTDLCAGPHLPNLSYLKAFKLTQIAGAYWRGNEKNKMLTAHLRHLLPLQGGAGRLPDDGGGSPQARPQQAGPGAGAVYNRGHHRAGAAHYPAQRHGDPPDPAALGGGHRNQVGLPAHQNAVYGQARAV